jgi:hypothetical protein
LRSGSGAALSSASAKYRPLDCTPAAAHANFSSDADRSVPIEGAVVIAMSHYARRSTGCVCSLLVAVLTMALPLAGRSAAGDGQVLHVGETTTLHLEGTAWALDRPASRQPHLVAVQSAGGKRFVVRGIKAGQTTLVFRSGAKTFVANIDVLN